MNTMYAVVAARTREIGTLRAIGFSRRAILLSFVVESAFLALAGGALGCLLASTAHGYSTGTANLQSYSEVATLSASRPGSSLPAWPSPWCWGWRVTLDPRHRNA